MWTVTSTLPAISAWGCQFCGLYRSEPYRRLTRGRYFHLNMQNRRPRDRFPFAIDSATTRQGEG